MKYLLIILLLIGCKKDEVKPVEQAPAKVNVAIQYGVYMWFDTMQPRYYLKKQMTFDKGSTFTAEIDLIDDRNVMFDGKVTPIVYNVQTPYHFCIWVFVNGRIKYKQISKVHKINLVL